MKVRKIGYAQEIKNNLPSGLEFDDTNEINKEYGWKLSDDKTNITTNYLSKENGTQNLLFAYKGDAKPSYKEVKLVLKISSSGKEEIESKAQISKQVNKDGENVNDIDSTPDVDNNGEDDQDSEKFYVQYFDLTLKACIDQTILIENGVENRVDTNYNLDDNKKQNLRIDINQKDEDSVIIKLRYKIRVQNEGEVTGTASEIIDYIPEGLEFNKADNPDWNNSQDDRIITTEKLKNTEIKPGENAENYLILTLKTSENIGREQANVIEISKEKNAYDTPDINSKPNNRNDDENDIKVVRASVISISNSGRRKIVFAILSVVTIIIVGILLIKRYIL